MTTAFNDTFVPSLVTVNDISSVEPFKSGVELSVNVALVASHTDITTPALIYSVSTFLTT